MPEWISQLIYLLPLAALIWKAAQLAADVKDLRHDLSVLQEQVKDEKNATDSVIVTITASLNDIKLSVARIETKLEERK